MSAATFETNIRELQISSNRASAIDEVRVDDRRITRKFLKIRTPGAQTGRLCSP
jgi:hypothetical protein